jgi:hypothetical protein
MKRAKHATRRIGESVRWMRWKILDDGPQNTGTRATTAPNEDVSDDSLPLEQAYGILARDNFAHAATVLDDEERRERLQSKAREYEALALAAVERRAIAEEATRKRSKGGKKTAKILISEREERDAVLTSAAKAILKDNPRIKILALAATLSERGHGGEEALRKKLPKLLPQLAGRPRHRRRTS